MSMFNDQQKKGILTEIKCIEKFIELGFSLSVPYGNANRYDLLVDTGNKILRVQCKSSIKNENGSYRHMFLVQAEEYQKVGDDYE